MNASDFPALTNFLNYVWALFNESLSWVIIIITVLGGITMYNEWKPKPNGIGTVELFVDDELGKLMERRELRISWGHLWFLNTLKLLHDESNETTIHLSSRPAGKLLVALPEDCSDERPERRSKSKKAVYLKNRRYFRKQSVDMIIAMLETPQTAHRQNVHCQLVRIGDVSELVITNDNAEEVRKYQLIVPTDIDPKSLDNTGNWIESLKIEIHFSQFGGTAKSKLGQLHSLGLPITLEIHSIPGRRGNEPGSVRIPIRTLSHHQGAS